MVPNMWFHPLNQLWFPPLFGWSTSLAAWHLGSSASTSLKRTKNCRFQLLKHGKHSIMFGIFLQGFDMLKPEFLDHVPSFPIISYGKSKILDDFGMVLWYHHRLGPWWSPGTGRHVMCWHSSVLGASITIK